MDNNNEITVEVNVKIADLNQILEKNKFKKIEEYDMNDIYFVKNDYQVNKNNILDTLKENLILRSLVIKGKVINLITFKTKKFNDKNEIINQSKINCSIASRDDAKSLLEAIGYKQLVSIKAHLIVYSNKEITLIVQLVDDKHIYIEIEEQNNKTIEDLKDYFNVLNIPVKDNNYFVKKAEVAIREMREV